MPETNVEKQRYSAPKEYGTLGSRSVGIKHALTQSDDFQNLPQLTQEMGFRQGDSILTKRAEWQVFTRPQHQVPNFPEGSTVINSQLALYQTEKGLTQAVLRTTEGSYNPNEEDVFRKDLEVFTKNYIERPRLLGFPSRAMTEIWGVLPAVGTGILIGGVMGYGATGEIANTGTALSALVGEITAPVAYTAAWWLSERTARRRVSNPDQYTVGYYTNYTLLSERSHTVRTAIQRELYAELREADPILSPDDFLNKIYGQLPSLLLQRRFKEVEATQFSGQPPVTDAQSALPSLVGVARFLQAA